MMFSYLFISVLPGREFNELACASNSGDGFSFLSFFLFLFFFRDEGNW